MTAGNQQERLGCYIAGYVDGEGSFHVGIQRSPNVWLGYQLVPEFHVSQNGERGSVLELIKEMLGCGYIKPNHAGNPRDRSSVLVVRNRKDLLEKVIPFFESYPIMSAKNEDFRKFAFVVTAMAAGHHLAKDRFLKLLKVAYTMNGAGRYRRLAFEDIRSNLESSETIRRTRSESATAGAGKSKCSVKI